MSSNCTISISLGKELLRKFEVAIKHSGKGCKGRIYDTYTFADHIYENEDYYLFLDADEYKITFGIQKKDHAVIARYKLTIQHIELKHTKITLTDFCKPKKWYVDLFDVVKRSSENRSLVHTYKINYFLLCTIT
jgi:hypothetical protein